MERVKSVIANYQFFTFLDDRLAKHRQQRLAFFKDVEVAVEVADNLSGTRSSCSAYFKHRPDSLASCPLRSRATNAW